VICGDGVLKSYLKQLAEKLGVGDQVHLLGYRNDIPEIYKAVDLFVFPSFREGLSVALMEAMASGLPVVCSKIRGNTDLIEDGKGGYLIEPNDVDGFVHAIYELVNGIKIRDQMRTYNYEHIKKFDICRVNKLMQKIYFEV